MTHSVGISAGFDVVEFGSAAEMERVFRTLQRIDAEIHADGKEIILDRLYRRYLKRNELDQATHIMTQYRAASEQGALSPIFLETEVSQTLGRFFENFFSAVESAKFFENKFNKYKPLRIVKTDIKGLLEEKEISLEMYDSLESKPIWSD